MNKISALIVDDSSVMRKIVARCLREAGIDLSELREAGSGVEALSELAKGPVDIVLCDINMPVMDGLEFVKQLQGRPGGSSIPVLASLLFGCGLRKPNRDIAGCNILLVIGRRTRRS